MARPIANARHVPPRTRRRQGSPLLLRTALVLALVLTLAYAVANLPIATSRVVATKGVLNQSPVASQTLLPGLASGACMSLSPTDAGPGQTIFIDPGHGGLAPGGVAGGAARPGLA